MSIKVTLITEEQFKSIRLSSDWSLVEIPQTNWEEISGIQRLHETFAIMGSATYNQPYTMHGKKNIFAGIDVLAHETRPKPNEPEINVYHYVFQITNDSEYFMYGPYKTGARIHHWSEFADIDSYKED